MDEETKAEYQKHLNTKKMTGVLSHTDLIKPTEIEFNNPPSKTQYNAEIIDLAELKSETSTKRNFLRKVDSQIVDTFNESLRNQ